ncbi:MAG: SpaA isopeptide-forming pilin-related protein [Chloroflexota bacterium]
MGVRTTPGSENTTKELVGGTLEPGGTALFRFTFPAVENGNPGQEEWRITDCVFLNNEPFQKYDVTALENDESPVVIEFVLTIPADTPVGAEYCNYAKTTQTPSDEQGSNRKAGPACFIVGGALRIEKNDASGAPLAGATFTVACDWPNVSEETFLPDTILSAPTNGTITPPGGVSTVTIDSTDDGSFTRTVVTGNLGVITVNGPVDTECTFTEIAAPAGYIAPTPPNNTVTLTIDDAGQQTHAFVNVLPSTPTPTPTLTPTPTPEGTQAGGTGTPAPSLPSTGMNLPVIGGTLAAILFGAILIASLGALAYVNVVAVRRRR